MEITKRFYVLIVLATIIPTIILAVMLAYSFYVEEEQELIHELKIATTLLDQRLQNSYSEILADYNNLESLDHKVITLNNHLQPIVDEVNSLFPFMKLGYYDLNLNRIIAYSPSSLHLRPLQAIREKKC